MVDREADSPMMDAMMLQNRFIGVHQLDESGAPEEAKMVEEQMMDDMMDD